MGRMLAADGTFIATVILAIAAVGAIIVSVWATRIGFNAERDAFRASVRPIIVDGLGDPYVDANDGFLYVPIRNVGPGVAAIRDVRIGPLGAETKGMCTQQVLPYDPNIGSVRVICLDHDQREGDVSVLIRYEDVGNGRLETAIFLENAGSDLYFIEYITVYFCDGTWTHKEPAFINTKPTK